MNAVDLSLKMKRLTQWLDGQRPPARFIRKRFDGPPFGNCYVTIDPDRQARFASGNMNCVYLCGAEPGMDSGQYPPYHRSVRRRGDRAIFRLAQSRPRDGGCARLA